LGTPAHAAQNADGDFNAAIAHAVSHALAGRHADAARVCRDALANLPDFASDGWHLPVEPLLHPSAHADAWAEALSVLCSRAS
jgi:hypothetical protein